MSFQVSAVSSPTRPPVNAATSRNVWYRPGVALATTWRTSTAESTVAGSMAESSVSAGNSDSAATVGALMTR
jgi:hypothetical protein